MSPRGFGTPIAVLLGAALIAWVLARGLDRIAAAEASHPSGLVTSTAAATPAPPVAPAAPPVRGERDEVRLRAEEQVQFAMVPQREAYVRSCWKPGATSPDGTPDLGGVFTFELGFDAQGAETTRTLRGTGPARPELAECVRKTKLAALKIAPPGKALTVSVSVPVP